MVERLDTEEATKGSDVLIAGVVLVGNSVVVKPTSEIHQQLPTFSLEPGLTQEATLRSGLRNMLGVDHTIGRQVAGVSERSATGEIRTFSAYKCQAQDGLPKFPEGVILIHADIAAESEALPPNQRKAVSNALKRRANEN